MEIEPSPKAHCSNLSVLFLTCDFRTSGRSPKVSGLRLFVGIRFQVYFTPLVGVLFTFPSRYLFAIGRTRVLRLGGWSPHVQTGFHVSRPTQGFSLELPVRGCHPLRPNFPDGSSCPC